MVIAAIATIHVLIAHFAVGAGLFIAVAETVPARRGRPLLRDFLKRFGRFLILFSFVGGALTGVGIWLAIGLAAPRATSLLIHNFVWGWAAEWALFAVEIAAGYLYYYAFEQLGERRRRAVAWIYAVAAWGSLVIINGILSFMLTPGRWLATHAFWDGFFNPSYWPSLLLRTISCLALGGIFVAIVASGTRAYSRQEARRIVNYAAWFLAPLVLMVPAGWWYFTTLPPEPLRLVRGAAVAMALFFAFGVAASTLVGLYGVVALLWKRRGMNLETALLLAAIAFVATGSIEFMREGIRKPYLIYGYLYCNGWTVEESARDANRSILTVNPWAVPRTQGGGALVGEALGRAVYQAQCAQCHNLDGLNDLKKLVATWDEKLLVQGLEDLHRLKNYMPPLVGSEAERRGLVQYLLTMTSTKRTERPGAAPARERAQ